MIANLLHWKVPVPVRFPNAECGVYIQWRKYKSADRNKSNSKPTPVGANLVQLKPVNLHRSLPGMVRSTQDGGKGREAIKIEDVPRLECTVTTVEGGSLRPMRRDADDWVQGKDGVVVSFEAPSPDGRLNRKATVFFPDYIEYHGWTLEEAIVKGISRKYKGPITPEVVQSIRLQRFSTERVSVFFSDYAAEREGEPLLAALEEKLKHSPKLVPAANKVSKKQAECNFFFKFLAGILLVAALMVYLRYSQLTYSVDYDDFLNNYKILGVEQGADLKTVKSAFRKLSRQWHPDKNPGCAECPEKYRLIAEANKQITDYEKGVLKFNANVPLNSRFRPR